MKENIHIAMTMNDLNRKEEKLFIEGQDDYTEEERIEFRKKSRHTKEEYEACRKSCEEKGEDR